MHSSANRNRGYIYKSAVWDNIFYAHYKTRAKIKRYEVNRRSLRITNYFHEDMIGIRII